MNGRLARGIAAEVVALPYRLRFASVGKRPRLFPPLMVAGGRRIALGDDVRIEALASLSAGPGGRLEIGSRCEIGSFARIEADEGLISIGADSSVNSFCFINGYGGVSIGQGVRIAAHCVVLSSSHHHGDSSIPISAQGVEGKKTVIEDDVWLGSHCVILGGVTIGAHSVIGAGAVVRKDIPPYSVAAGVPARVLRSRR